MAKKTKKEYQAPEIKVDELPIEDLEKIAGGLGSDDGREPSSQRSRTS